MPMVTLESCALFSRTIGRYNQTWTKLVSDIGRRGVTTMSAEIFSMTLNEAHADF